MQETEIDIRAIINLLRRRIRLILATIIIVVGAAMLYAFSLTPTFTSSTLILVDIDATEILNPMEQTGGISSGNARIDSEVEILKSDNILLSVIDKKNLITDPEFGVKTDWGDNLLSFLRIKDISLPTGDEALNSVMAKLKKAISVKRKGLTYLISLSASSVSPQNAANTANAVADAYIEAQVQSTIENILAARDILQSRMIVANQTIIASEQSFDKFISDNIDNITVKTGRVDIAQMRQELERLLRARQDNVARADAVNQNISLKNWVEVSKDLQDEALQELQRQNDQLNADMSNVSSGSQLQIDLQAELAKIDNSLLNVANNGLSALRQSIAGDQVKASQLRQQIRTLVIESSLPADILTKIYTLQQNAEIARSQYQTLISRIQELEVQAQTQIAYSRVVSEALPPSNPSYPNKKLIFLLSLISSLGLGVGLAFLYENYVGGFSSEDQIENVLHLPVVATIPRIDITKNEGEKTNQLSAADQIGISPLSAYSEGIRRLRFSIDHSLKKKIADQVKDEKVNGSVILVSSAVPNEGKSTIALSLGRTIAQSGRRVLLIDCDLRKPSLHRFLGVKKSVGLADYLQNSDDSSILNEVIVSDKESPLAAIVGSQNSEMPTDQLACSRELAKLISNAKERFEYVILDSPPILPVIDGLYLAEYADVIAMVIRWGATSQKEAKEAISQLNTSKPANSKIMMVLNQEEGGKQGYRYKYSSYYSSYYN